MGGAEEDRRRPGEAGNTKHGVWEVRRKIEEDLARRKRGVWEARRKIEEDLARRNWMKFQPYEEGEVISRSIERFIMPSNLEGMLSMLKSNMIEFLMSLNKQLGNGDINFKITKKNINDMLLKTIGIHGDVINLIYGNNNQALIGNKIEKSKITQNNSLAPDEINTIRETIHNIKIHCENIEGELRNVLERHVIEVERHLEKPSSLARTVIFSTLQTIHALLIEATGSAYSPLILDQLKSLIS